MVYYILLSSDSFFRPLYKILFCLNICEHEDLLLMKIDYFTNYPQKSSK